MEDELKCGVCKQLFTNPVLLPCCHSLCLNCAVHIQGPAREQPAPAPTEAESGSGGGGGGSESGAESTSSTGGDHPDVDKLSIVSETDSGVVCTSRPSSYVGTPNLQGLVFPLLSNTAALSLACPTCHKLVYFDENGALNLPRNRAMQNIVDKYGEGRNLPVTCQLCAGPGEPAEAAVFCEQCEVFYCAGCRDSCHPARGPLAKHTLLGPQQGKAALRARSRGKPPACNDHPDESLAMYCLLCKSPACAMCLQEGRHAAHDVQALSAMCKAHKTELSQNLQALSEKAKQTTELIQRLKSMSDRLNDSCSELEGVISAQCQLLVEAVQLRERQLVEYVRQERDFRLKTLKEQVGSCTCKLQQTTGLLQFCIEALKETDPTAFLQIGNSLITRVGNVDLTWHRDMATSPQVAPELDFTLDDKPLYRAIDQLNFLQIKPPAAPSFIPEECCSENNSVSIVWQPHPASFVEGFVLELDDGNDGAFREVYCGKETMCTVDGLHFNSVYNARVKAFNSTGEGEYSDFICLQTAEVAWFTLDLNTAHSDIKLSNDNRTVNCDSYEHRLVLGNVGFSRGIHYWEVTVDRYENNADPSFGVARFDACKDAMLGKDDKGWGMYIDHQRSWFLHGDKHENRTEGGVEAGAVVGVLLDLQHRQLSFYVNQELQGPVAFGGLHGVFYPALSLNRCVQATIHTSMDPPVDHSSDAGDASN